MHRSTAPVDDDDHRQKQATEGIHPPDPGVESDDGEEDGACIKDNIRHGVIGEGTDGGVLDDAAPEPAGAFDDHSANHDGNGRDATEFRESQVQILGDDLGTVFTYSWTMECSGEASFEMASRAT